MDDLHAPTVASGPTSRATANGTEKKLSLQELMSKKENLEAELSALGSVLDSHGVNMNTSLTTFDGYPRADIDVAQIRTTRARIIRLKNDHKAIMAKLETAIHEAFASGKVPEGATNGTGAPTETAMNGSSAASETSAPIEPPFARVNTVIPNSPAAQAGLLVGDKITKFGYVNWQNHERLSKVAQVVQQNENYSEKRLHSHLLSHVKCILHLNVIGVVAGSWAVIYCLCEASESQTSKKYNVVDDWEIPR
ncbi:26S proteasome non-ATPase regulatory subunit 9-like [Teratosphaeria destructans]|uniref:26S proteasome non-ATPase regulatory subunit 9-like n=1 Tax=Teratosphaeria destructans TaxID=418781 RepID=A0A9W7W3P5_9PEZI|nr:26S proteasome non-ATPase regulatory subunit 9-like [Teratosphaeria destructans]